jgi:hypothetical protein
LCGGAVADTQIDASLQHSISVTFYFQAFQSKNTPSCCMMQQQLSFCNKTYNHLIWLCLIVWHKTGVTICNIVVFLPHLFNCLELKKKIFLWELARKMKHREQERTLCKSNKENINTLVKVNNKEPT